METEFGALFHNIWRGKHFDSLSKNWAIHSPSPKFITTIPWPQLLQAASPNGNVIFWDCWSSWSMIIWCWVTFRCQEPSELIHKGAPSKWSHSNEMYHPPQGHNTPISSASAHTFWSARICWACPSVSTYPVEHCTYSQVPIIQTTARVLMMADRFNS